MRIDGRPSEITQEIQEEEKENKKPIPPLREQILSSIVQALRKYGELEIVNQKGTNKYRITLPNAEIVMRIETKEWEEWRDEVANIFFGGDER